MNPTALDAPFPFFFLFSLFALSVVTQAIEMALSKDSTSFNEALSCLGLVIRVSADFKENDASIRRMLVPMLRRGLNKTLAETFEVVMQRITPDVRKLVQEQLFTETTHVITR
jgi:hypothetical protein